uniref:XS domain-containing protein n=1 Tax=Solanum tuberosum TaxID=4113 RepID=M1BPX6_SOLTU
MRLVESDVNAVGVYRDERLRGHGVELDYDRCFMRDTGVMGLYSRRERSLSPLREERPRRVSWQRREAMDGDQDFSDRCDMREPQLRREVMDRDQHFSDRGDMREPQLRREVMDRDQQFSNTREPQLRRSGLMRRDEELTDRGDIREPQLSRSGLMMRDEEFSDRGDIRESPLRRSGLMVRDEEFNDRGDMREPQLRRSGLMVRDEEFSDRGDIREPPLKRSGLMVKDEEFNDRGDIREPQLRRSGLVVRDEEFNDRGDIREPQYRGDVVQPQLKSPPVYHQVHEKPQHHYQASLSRDEEESRRYELFDYEDRYEAARRTGVDYDYEYDCARSVQGHNVNIERGGVHHYELDRHKQLGLEDGLSRGAHSLPFDSQSATKYVETARGPLSAHVQPQEIRLRDEIARYPDPFLLDKLSAIEMLEREERTRFHPKDVSRYTEPALQSKDLALPSQYKECLATSSGTSRMNYAPMIQDDMHLLGDIHSRFSTKLRQPLYLNEYEENHSYNTLEDYAAGHKGLTSYQSDKVSSPRGDNMDHVYPKGRPRDTSDYGHSYVRTTLPEQAVLDNRHARAQILLEPLRENISDNEFPRRDVINSTSWDHHSLNKQPVSMSFFDGRSLAKSTQGQFYLDSNDTNVDTQNVRESDIENLDVPCHEEIHIRRLDYHSSKDEHSNFYAERGRRSPRLVHEMEMLGDRVRPKKIESGVIECNGHPIRSEKRKYILDEEMMGHSSGRIVFSDRKNNINRTQDIDYRNEVWDDQDASCLLSPENFEDDKWLGKPERLYSRDLNGRVAATNGLLSYRGSINQGKGYLIRPYNPGKKQKVYENPSSLRQYVSIQCNKKHHLTKNVWIRDKDDKQTEASDHVVKELKDQAACAKPELPEDSIEFTQLVHNFSLSYTKKLNESVATQKRYKEQGRAGGLFCIVCANSQLKEFKDTRSLAVHCYMSQKVWLKAKHLGLHKAICVLMGWNSDAPPDGKLWLPVAVPAPNALAQKEDLILWPPVVVIHNCSGLVTGLDGQKVTTTEAVENFLRGKGFSGGRMKVCMGKPGNGSVLLVKFLGTIPGIQDAEKLHNYFMEEERGRKDFRVITSTKGKGIDNRNVKGGKAEEISLYGYMGIAEDLDKVDIDTKRRSLIKSKKEIRDFVDAPVKSEVKIKD